MRFQEEKLENDLDRSFSRYKYFTTKKNKLITHKIEIMTKRLLTIALFIIVSLSVSGQENKGNTEYTKTLKQMFEVSGSEGAYKTAIKQMFAMYKQQYSNVEAEVWNDLEKECTKTSLNDLANMLAPVYSKYMTIKDLKELIKFYKTPVGKKFAKSTPFIMKESMQVGQQWGMKIGQQFIKKLKEKGY